MGRYQTVNYVDLYHVRTTLAFIKKAIDLNSCMVYRFSSFYISKFSLILFQFNNLVFKKNEEKLFIQFLGDY